MKTMVINGETFEVIHSGKTQGFINYHLRNYDERDLFDYYDKPSYIKQRIFNDWYDWYLDTYGVDKLEVVSASTFKFTIGALWLDPDTLEIIGYIRITDAHNRLYLFK